MPGRSCEIVGGRATRKQRSRHLAGRVAVNLFNLKGKVAVITGGNGGIGLGMAEGIASLGANIVIAGRDTEKASSALAVLRELGVKAEFVSADVTKKTACEALITEAENLFGRVDILVNN